MSYNIKDSTQTSDSIQSFDFREYDNFSQDTCACASPKTPKCENAILPCEKCENPAIPTRSITDILQSVALEEAALAHILNAEGEKIQKAVQIAQNTCELLCVNDSVVKTIDSVIIMEVLLLNKLKTALDAPTCNFSPLPLVTAVSIKGNVILACGCAAKNAVVTVCAKTNHTVRTDNCGRFCIPFVEVCDSFVIRAECNDLCSAPITKYAPFDKNYTLLLEV